MKQGLLQVQQRQRVSGTQTRWESTGWSIYAGCDLRRRAQPHSLCYWCYQSHLRIVLNITETAAERLCFIIIRKEPRIVAVGSRSDSTLISKEISGVSSIPVTYWIPSSLFSLLNSGIIMNLKPGKGEDGGFGDCRFQYEKHNKRKWVLFGLILVWLLYR